MGQVRCLLRTDSLLPGGWAITSVKGRGGEALLQLSSFLEQCIVTLALLGR